MGYRLEIENEDKTLYFYGTKHYGYGFEFAYEVKDKYPSIRYLLSLDKLKEETYFDYGNDIEVILNPIEFIIFITLYAMEYNFLLLDNVDIRKLCRDNTNKILTWG